MFHANAWGIPYCKYGWSQASPARKTFRWRKCLRYLKQEKVTFTAAVPTIWLMLFEYLDKTKKKIDFYKDV